MAKIKIKTIEIVSKPTELEKKLMIKGEEIVDKLTEIRAEILGLEKRFSAAELQSEILKEYREKIKNYFETVQKEFTISFKEIDNMKEKMFEKVNESAREMISIIQFLYNTLNNLKKIGINEKQKGFLLAQDKEFEEIISQSKYLGMNKKMKGESK